MNEPQSVYRYDFELELDGVVAVLNEDGSVSLLNADNERIYYIPAPFMEDANGELSYEVSYSLATTVNGVILSVEADAEWLNAEARTFPVIIDPTIEVQAGSDQDDIYTSHTVQGKPDTSYGGYQYFHLGYSEWLNTQEYRGFVHFNNIPTIPSGAVITEALFGLYMHDYSYVNLTELGIGAYEVTGEKPETVDNYYDWIYNLTWNTMPTYDTTNMIDYAVVSNAAQDQYYYWDLSELVKKWYTEETENRTIAMTMNSGTYSNSNYAQPVFYAWANNSPPMLFVSYRSVLGIEDYYTYATLGAGAAGSAYISDYTGQLTISKGLVSYASTINPFAMSLIYNSNYNANNDLDSDYPSEEFMDARIGIGWTLDVLQTVEPEIINNTTYLKYRDGDGTVHYFQKDLDDPDNSVYYDEDGLGLEITIDETQTVYTLSDSQDNTYIFRSGVLEMMQDNNGNCYLFHYTNGKLTGIGQKNNGAASEITVASFAYTGEFLTSVTDAAGLVYTLNYTNNNLTSISQGNTVLAQYGYSGNNLVSATDSESGYTLNFSYDTQGRVCGYFENEGNERGAQVSVSYDTFEKTAYRDFGNDRTSGTADDILTYYLFDYGGHTVNAYSTDANGCIIGASNAVYYDGDAIDRRNNRTIRTASIGVAAEQELRNSSFENNINSPWTIEEYAEISTELPRTGNYSLTATVSNVARRLLVSKTSQTLYSGTTYTLSGYVNTEEMTFFSSFGPYFMITDPSGTSWSSDCVTYQTSETVDNGWVRINLTFTAEITGPHTISVHCKGCFGTFYVDDLQLEQGNAPSNRNLLENGNFQASTLGWTLGSGSFPTTSFGMYQVDNEIMSLSSVSNPSSTRTSTYQTVPINLPGTQTYILSGWAQGNAVPDNRDTAEDYAQDTEKTFGIRAIVNYSDETNEYFYVPFNSNVSDWQYSSMAIVPTETAKTVASITVICAFEKNANTVHFDNISLVRDAVQTMQYDTDGNWVSTSTTGMETDTNTYEKGNLIETVTGTGSTYSFTYDDTYTHRLLSSTDGVTTQSMTYDGVGNVTSSVFAANEGDGRSLISSSSYSPDGNRTTVSTDTNNVSTTYGYGTAVSQMLGAATSITDANNTVTTVTYDNLGRTTQTSIANQATLTYTYSDGNLCTIKRENSDGTEQNYELFYDSFGNLGDVGVGGYTLVAYNYADNNGLPDMQVYGNMDTFIYTYDDLGRIKTATYDDGRKVTYTYNGEGQLHSLKETGGDSPATYLYTYDSIDNLVASEKKDQNGNTVLRVHQNYDSAGQLVGQTWYAGDTGYSESYTYNVADGSLNTIVTGTGETIQFSYDDLQRLTATGNGLYTRNYSYHNLSDARTTTQVSQVQYTGLPTALTYGYTYDSLGNIATYSAPGKGTVAYTYDALGQLLSAVGDETYTYTYDTVGNILTANGHTYTYGDSGWKDLLTAYDGQTITYDDIGNPLSYYNGTRWTFGWENGRSLATANNGTTSISYAYDANGLRTGKTVGNVTHNYLYASGQLLQETYGDNTLDFFYDASGHPYALNYNGTTYYYITNLQGDVMYLVDAQGNTVASYDYDPYGNIISATGTIAEINPLRYRGYYYDAELEMYYLQSRYYDPQIGRFINTDVFVSTGTGIVGCNMFAYCGNDPVKNMDPTGDIFIDAAMDLLNQWLYGDGSFKLYKAGSSIVKALQKSKKMKSHILKAINDYILNGKAYTGLLYDEFTHKADGWDLYLSTQHFKYEIFVYHETRTKKGLFRKYEQERYVALIYVQDVYDFDLKPWEGVGNILNNIAYKLNQRGVGNDYKWVAMYYYYTRWKKVS